MIVHAIPVLRDNYAYVCEHQGECWVIDPGEASPIQAWLAERDLVLKGFLITHYHLDHTAGLADLYQDGHLVYGDWQVEQKTSMIEDKMSLKLFDGVEAYCMHLPGHTLGAMGFVIEDCVFTGDVLFGAGMGRIFEGSVAQMHASLMKLKQLPDHTKVYFGHEYTLQNLRFAMHVEPDHQGIKQRLKDVEQVGVSTPSHIKIERETNPFLRLDVDTVSSAVAKWAGKSDLTEDMCLKYLREWKNQFDEGGQ
ncbi:hydroxyacylglutathione hydrolase [Gammaproteobacteria bacterium]|nr:hydroxyacylglutathione hydrolase [Gammaproteobacteria bacterium]